MGIECINHQLVWVAFNDGSHVYGFALWEFMIIMSYFTIGFDNPILITNYFLKILYLAWIFLAFSM